MRDWRAVVPCVSAAAIPALEKASKPTKCPVRKATNSFPDNSLLFDNANLTGSLLPVSVKKMSNACRRWVALTETLDALLVKWLDSIEPLRRL